MDSERAGWIKELSESKEQLGRLHEQVQDIMKTEHKDFRGMLERISHLQIRLGQIKHWLENRQ